MPQTQETILTKIRTTSAFVPVLALAVMPQVSNKVSQVKVSGGDLVTLGLIREPTQPDSSAHHNQVDIQFRAELNEWGKQHEKRFNHLAKLEALDRLSASEQGELEQLTRARRRLNNQRSTDEILREVKQRQVTQNLLSALKAYAEFHNS